MFGTYRTILALAVVLNHLAGVSEIGRHAVFGFFVLSGYLMNLIVHESYGYSADGIRRFAINRFLRIFPTYWCVAAITLLVIYLLPSARDFHAKMHMPYSIENISANFFIVLSHKTDPRIVPQAWALTVELFWYSMIALGISRTKTLTWVWWAFGAAYAVYVSRSPNWNISYFNILTGALPFASGGLLFHYKDLIKRPFLFILAGSAIFFTNYLVFLSEPDNVIVCCYINLLAQTCIMCGLIGLRSPPPSWDKWIGNLSYPMYLSHWVVGFLVFLATGLQKGLWLYLVATPIILTVSYAISVLVDQRIDRIRSLIRPTPKPSISHNTKLVPPLGTA